MAPSDGSEKKSKNPDIVRPTLSFSRYGTADPKKGKLHANKQRWSKQSEPSSFVHRSAPIPSLEQDDKELEDLERSFLEDSPPENRKPRARESAPRPPIPSFLHLSDDDIDDGGADLLLAAPVLSSKSNNSQKPAHTINSQKNASIIIEAEHNAHHESENGKQQLNVYPNSCPDVDPTKGNEEKYVGTSAASRVKKRSQPSVECLVSAVDRLFVATSDPTAITQRKFIQTLAAQLDSVFTATTKSFVKARVTSLLNGEVTPVTLEKNNDNATGGKTKKTRAPSNAILSPNEYDDKACEIGAVNAPLKKYVGRDKRGDEIQSFSEETFLRMTKNAAVETAAGIQENLASVEGGALQGICRLGITNSGAMMHQQSTVFQAGGSQGPYPNQLALLTHHHPRSSISSRDPDHRSLQNLSQVPQKIRDTSSSHTEDPLHATTGQAISTGALHADKFKRDQSVKKTGFINISDHMNTDSAPKVTKAPVRRKRCQPAFVVESADTKKAEPKSRKRAKTPTCSLCKACPCSKGNSDRASLDVNSLSTSAVAIERRLIRRLQKLEKTAEQYEEQAEAAKRQLQKHRREIFKHQEAKLNLDNLQSGEYRFLPDGEELDEQFECSESKLRVPVEDINQALTKLLGKTVQIVGQTTLTQLFGGGRKDKDDEPRNPDAIAQQQSPFHVDAEKIDSLVDDSLQKQTNDILPVEYSINEHEQYLDDDEEQTAIGANRISWKNGSQSQHSHPSRTPSRMDSATTMWGTLLAAAADNREETSFDCPWNKMFEDDPIGIDHLLDLFGSSNPSPNKVATSAPLDDSLEPDSPTDLSMLSQRGQRLAVDLEDQICSSPSKILALNAACPKWRENIAYALRQRDDGELREALANIKRSRERQLKTKESFLRAWQQHQTVLDVFELSLNQSLIRLENDSPVDGGHGLTPQSTADTTRIHEVSSPFVKSLPRSA